jgi:hypothetical protein
MRGYEVINRLSTGCVHFIRTGSSGLFEAQALVSESGGKFAYWNYLDGGREAATLANPLAIALELEHAPYGNLSWTQFLDDLITLAYRHEGLAIVIDRADLLIAERRDEMFDCIEAFLIQLHHWYDQKKPCHLYFQIGEVDGARGT